MAWLPGYDATTFGLLHEVIHLHGLPQPDTEFRRILKPNRHVALIWNERRIDDDPLQREYENLLLQFSILRFVHSPGKKRSMVVSSTRCRKLSCSAIGPAPNASSIS